jgi:hypothetical protein
MARLIPPEAVADGGSINSYTNDRAGADAGDELVHFGKVARVKRDKALAVCFCGRVKLIEVVPEEFVNDGFDCVTFAEIANAADFNFLHHQAADPRLLGDGLNDRAELIEAVGAFTGFL